MLRDVGFLRPVIRSGVVIGVAAVIVPGYFSYIWFELYGDSALCVQKYNAPSLSFYSETHDCVIAISELFEAVMYIAVFIAVPLFSAFALLSWIFMRKSRSGDVLRRGAQKTDRGGSPEGSRSHGTGLESHFKSFRNEAHIVFWALTLSVVLPVTFVQILGEVTGVGNWRAEEIIGAAIFYSLHLYLAAFIVFGVVLSVVYISGLLKRK
jgi:hypothetical protein